MSDIPSQHPTLAVHLTDGSLNPLITSSSSESQLDSVTALAASAIKSRTTLQRARMGNPQRIMVEYPDRGPVVLQSYLDPPDIDTSHINRRDHSKKADVAGGHSKGTGSRTSNTSSDTDGEGSHRGRLDQSAAQVHRAGLSSPKLHSGKPEDSTVPTLIGLVVAGSVEDVGEARRAALRLEKFGRDFQKQWTSDGSGSSDGAGPRDLE